MKVFLVENISIKCTFLKYSYNLSKCRHSSQKNIHTYIYLKGVSVRATYLRVLCYTKVFCKSTTMKTNAIMEAGLP